MTAPSSPQAEFAARLVTELERRTAVLPAMLHSIDEHGRLVSVSDAWLATLGYTRDEVLGRLSSDFLTAASREYATKEVLPEFFRVGRCENIQYQMVCKDGSIIDVLLSAVLDHEVTCDGRVSFAVLTDVTALKQTKRELIASEARYRHLVENQSELVSLASPEGELRFVNQAYAAFYGRSPEELIGRSFFDFVPEEARAWLVDHLRLVCSAGESSEVKNQVTLPNGQHRWFAWTNRAIRDVDGRVVAIHSVGRDIDQQVTVEERLKESEARYRFLADNSSDVIALLGRDGARLYVSPACRALTGYEPEEMLATRTSDTTHPDDVARVMDLLANMDGPITVTYRMRRKDGSYVWVETACKPVTVDGREDVRLAVVRNIEDRVQAELRLQESEERYRFLAENSTDLIILVNRDGKRLYASPACRTMLGYEPEEMLALRTQDAVHPDDEAKILTFLKSGWPDHTNIYRMRRKDGSFVWVEATGKVFDTEGHADQRLVIVRDIEQRIAAEQRVTESEARYRLLADNSSDMVFQLDEKLARRYVSPACREILGYEPEEMIGITPVATAHPEDAARIALVFQSLMSGHLDRQSIINRIRHRDGRYIWIEAQLRALKDPETGRPTGVIGALRDISARKAIEDKLEDANRRLKSLATKDGLTGLANRRAFDEALAIEFRRATRSHTTLGLIMIDVDLFKSFNDCFGHPAGDECLRRIAGAIANSVSRPADVAARYGGEEFAVLLPDTDEPGVTRVAERIRLAVLDLKLEHKATSSGFVTVSAGAASQSCAAPESSQAALVDAADHALYNAKNAGRNAVVQASARQAPVPSTSSKRASTR